MPSTSRTGATAAVEILDHQLTWIEQGGDAVDVASPIEQLRLRPSAARRSAVASSASRTTAAPAAGGRARR